MNEKNMIDLMIENKNGLLQVLNQNPILLMLDLYILKQQAELEVFLKTS